MRRHEVMIDQVIAPEDMQEGKGQGRVAAGKELQVQVSSRKRQAYKRGSHRRSHPVCQPWGSLVPTP
jgi:hypothetical protein